MLEIIGLMVAISGVIDLFSAHHTVPWWGDIIAIVVGVVVLLVTKVMDRYDDDDVDDD